MKACPLIHNCLSRDQESPARTYTLLSPVPGHNWSSLASDVSPGSFPPLKTKWRRACARLSFLAARESRPYSNLACGRWKRGHLFYPFSFFLGLAGAGFLFYAPLALCSCEPRQDWVARLATCAGQPSYWFTLAHTSDDVQFEVKPYIITKK